MVDTRPTQYSRTLGNRYTIGPLLGRGGMAEVHRAYDSRLGREVAVKLFRPDVADAGDLRRVRGEIRTLARLNHPALVTLYDASDGDGGGPAYLVLELVEGSDLATLLRSGTLHPAEIVALVGDVASALSYIHGRGIVHRDIKPENVLVHRGDDGGMHAKLADLGIARIVDESHLTEAGAVLGTAAYLSPEQATGGRVGTASDVYSLGLVLIEALTGQRPFRGTRAESALARTSRPPELPDGLDDGDRVLLERATALDPGDRPSAAELHRGLLLWRSRGPFAPFTSDGDPIDEDDPLGFERDAFETGALEDEPAAAHETAATALLPASSTEVLPSPRQEPPTELVRPSWEQTSATEVLPAHGSSPRLVPQHDVPADARPGDGWGDPTELLRRPGAEPPRQPASDREDGRRRRRRRLALVVVVLALLAGGVVAAWPLLSAAIVPQRPPAPAYPAVEGDLGERLGVLQTSVGGDGIAYQAQETLQGDVLAVTEAAAAEDYSAATGALTATSTHLDLAATADQVTSARYRDVVAAIDPVQEQIDAIVAELEEQQRLEEQRLEEERQAVEEAQRQAELDEQQRQQQEEQGGQWRDRLDEIGRDLQEQWERLFGA